MEFKIAELHECGTMNCLDFGKEGNKYWVCYHDRDLSNFTKKIFPTAAQAAEVYLRLAGWILHGCYSDENRRSFLLTGTMR